MDDIDITTPEFSLSRVPDLTEIVSNIVHTTDPELPDYAMYILGAMLMALAGIVFYISLQDASRELHFRTNWMTVMATNVIRNLPSSRSSASVNRKKLGLLTLLSCSGLLCLLRFSLFLLHTI